MKGERKRKIKKDEMKMCWKDGKDKEKREHEKGKHWWKVGRKYDEIEKKRDKTNLKLHFSKLIWS